MISSAMPAVLEKKLIHLLKEADGMEASLLEILESSGIPLRKIVKLAENTKRQAAAELTETHKEPFLTPLMRIHTATALHQSGLFGQAARIILPAITSSQIYPQIASLTARLLAGLWRTNEALSICRSKAFSKLPPSPRLLIPSLINLFEGHNSTITFPDAGILNSLPAQSKCFAALIMLETGRTGEALTLLESIKNDPYSAVIKAVAFKIIGQPDQAMNLLIPLDIPIHTEKENSWLNMKCAESIVDLVAGQWNETTPDYDLFKNHLTVRLIHPTGNLKEILTDRYTLKIHDWHRQPDGEFLPETPFSEEKELLT